MSTGAPFVFVSNHLCLDFVNTEPLRHGDRVDLLDTPPALLRWLQEANLLDTSISHEWVHGSEGEHALAQARAFRQAVRTLLDEWVEGGTISEAALDTLNQTLTRHPGTYQLERGTTGFSKQFIPLPEAPLPFLSALAEATVDLFSEGDLAYIKQCGNPDCVLFFYDTTKNHSRRWCSMETCGNRMKVAAYHRRKRRKAP